MSFHGFISVSFFSQVVCRTCYHISATGEPEQPRLLPSSQLISAPPTSIAPAAIIPKYATPEPDEQQTGKRADTGSSSNTDTSSDSENDGEQQETTVPKWTAHVDTDDTAGDVPNPDHSNNDDASQSDSKSLEADTVDDAYQSASDDESPAREISPPYQLPKTKNRGKAGHGRSRPLQSATIRAVDSDDSGPQRIRTIQPRRARAPDLPLIFPPIPKRNVSDIISVPAEKISVKGVTAKMFFAKSSLPPKCYEFKVSEKMVPSLPLQVYCSRIDVALLLQAPIEHALLRRIQKSVEKGYRDGLPPHHQESAQMLNPEAGGSQFFVTTTEAFARLSGDEVQAIFRDRHILIPGDSSAPSSFSRKGLAELGSLYAPRDIQCLFIIHHVCLLPHSSLVSEFAESHH